MKTVLSTRLLSQSQKELFLNSGIGLVEYNAIQIELSKLQIPEEFYHLIFTSKNAVKAFLQSSHKKDYSGISAYCVGEKTKQYLEDHGINVVKMAENAVDLAHFIVKTDKNRHFLFISGNLRRSELPEILSKNNVRYKEIEGYSTLFKPKKFQREFDGILFYSPSGIKSFVQENPINNTVLFCIGNTTAEEARKYSDQIVVASKPTVENVLVKAIKHCKQYD
nr:uroporphyrinogen-III synthase [Allomuricauda sp.]